jgi:hypothetical protein
MTAKTHVLKCNPRMREKLRTSQALDGVVGHAEAVEERGNALAIAGLGERS